MKYEIISRTLILITALFLITSIEVSAQVSITDSDPRNIPEAVELPDNTIEKVIIVGDLTFFDNEDEDLFNKTCPDLAVEDFEDTKVGSNSVGVCSNPINSSTSGDCYLPGALIPGFSYSVLLVQPAVVTPFLFGITNVAVAHQTSISDAVITFTEVVNAVGIVIVNIAGVATPVDVQVFGLGNIFLGSATVNVTPINGTFLGVRAGGGEQITRIELAEIGGGTLQIEGVYELSFGFLEPEPTTIPTLSEWGLIAMAGILGIAGFMVMRRKKVRA